MIACLEQRFLPESEAVPGTGAGEDASRDGEEDFSLLGTLELLGSLEFPSRSSPPPPAARDFGGVYQHRPAA